MPAQRSRLEAVELEVARLAQRLGAAPHMLPTYGRTEGSARPHVELDAEEFQYVVIDERGIERERTRVRDVHELLEIIFRSVTFELACDFELQHRIAGQDFRRLLFRKQVELLSSLAAEWGEREALRHAEILREHPFDDASDARLELSKAVGWETACERYPLPRPE